MLCSYMQLYKHCQVCIQLLSYLGNLCGTVVLALAQMGLEQNAFQIDDYSEKSMH